LLAQATAWHSNKFLNPITDGAVLPILHLNGYKIANPTILARISRDELESLFVGYGYQPYVVEGEDPQPNLPPRAGHWCGAPPQPLGGHPDLGWLDAITGSKM
jgi:phosphoketolase